MTKVYYEILLTSLAVRPLPVPELTQLIHSLTARNESMEITGSLLYNNREFVQLLEGEKDSLNKLMDEVEDDSSHGNIHVVWEKEIEELGFENYGFCKKMIPIIGKDKNYFASTTGVISVGQQLMDEFSTSLDL